MFFSPWNRDSRDRSKPSPKARHQSRPEGHGRFRPQLEGLEDRLVPSGQPFFFFPSPVSGPATQLEVIVPANSQIGVPEQVEVIALTASNRQAFGYTGIIHFSSTDSGATLPGDFTFGPQNHGAAYFKATFATLGSQTLTATDTTTASITGSAITQVNPAPVATHFLVVSPGQALTGQTISFTVTALDASNHKVPNYAGSIHFSSTDSAAVLPANATLTGGVGKFTMTLNTVGAQTVSATDTASASIKGTTTIQVSAPGVATHFAVFAIPIAGSGKTYEVFVVALDATNQLATTYPGTVQFSSSDSAATLPPNSTLSGGVGKFSVTLATNGRQTITVTDTSDATLTGSTKVYVGRSFHFGWFGF